MDFRAVGVVENFANLSLKTVTGSSCYMNLMIFLTKKIIGFLSFITYIRTGKLCLTVISTYVILYETPRFGAHHYSLGFQNSSEQAKSAVKKPNWVNKIQQKQPLFELESVIVALNSAAAAKSFFKEHVESQAPFVRFSIICMLAAFTRKLFAVCISVFSTLFYIILQCLYRLWYRSQLQIFVTVMKVFITTCKIIQMRCSQILYWPVFLQAYGPRSQSCVEYAEKTTSHNHSMWSGVAVDVILGNLIGLALLIHSEFVCVLVFNFANDITNNFLRTGSVWLMGAPAGFKLNTELAQILGMISLNVIQIWSTLWFFLGFCFIFFIRGLAVCGILFGVTVPAAMIIDMITLATSHISTLHWLISFLYSHQILALAALWRLFRGRKWNPLRKRLDSYHYTVDQHIVGSLLFTPLLLLLPTTSVFYIFFTIMNTSISLTCVLIEIIISIIHATPYNQIFIWLVRRQRFPSGIWFEILSCQNNEVKPSEIENSKDSGLPLQYSWQRIDTPGSGCSVLIYLLHSNFLSIGQIVMPHYRQVFCGVSGHLVGSLAYGVLTGRRIPSSLGIVPTSKMPWMSIPCKEYWCLCRDSVLARKQ